MKINHWHRSLVYSLLFMGSLGLTACSNQTPAEDSQAATPTEEATSPPDTPAHNTLTAEEEAAGWRLLFDGKSTDGWHNYGTTTIGSSWVVEDDALHLTAEKDEEGIWRTADGGDILTDDQFENFELQLEWKLTPCGNSGIMYLVEESDQYDYPWQTGPEMQVLDAECHPDGKIEKHRAGDLYDMIAADPVTVRPAGEWNQVRVIVNNGQLEHWMNGEKVVETTIFTDSWREMIANSKFVEFPGFGTVQKGHIALQDHNDAKVWYRNIKIREL